MPSKTRHSSILMVLAFYLGFTSLQAEGQSQKAASPQKNVVNQAYQAIQNRRRQIVNKYVEALFTIGELCVTKKYTEAGRKITERILKVVEPPKNRRKVTSVAAGIGLDQTGDRQVLEKGLVVAEVHQKPLSPEDTQHLNEVREKVAALREKLGISGKAEEKAADPNPLQLPPSDDKDDAKKPEGEKDPQKKTKTSTTKVEPGSQGKKAGSNPQEKASAPGEEEIDNKEKSAREALISSVEKLGNQCLKQGYPAHAYEILLWAIEIDPDNKNLRRTVRENAYTDKSGKLHWYSPYDLAKAKQGYIEHPEYGWVTPAQIKALDAGKLWYKGQWMPKDFVDNQRQKWENRWTYETEHFEVFTNAPLRDAVVFGREVERLYSFFFRVFIDFYSTGNWEADSHMVFAGGKDVGKKKLRLNYFRSREHFLAEVKKDPELKNAGGMEVVPFSAGFYWKGNGKAYFFRGPTGPDLSVIYHEVTHQIFGETYTQGARPPVWLVEGFGVFMEDPVVRGERLLAGAEPPPGIRRSSYRDINDFVKNYQSHEQFHGEKRTDNYATAGAVVHFFLFYKGGIYRQGFMRYAREAYRNDLEDGPTTIKKLYEYLNVSETQLQNDWVAFNNNPDLFDF